MQEPTITKFNNGSSIKFGEVKQPLKGGRNKVMQEPATEKKSASQVIRPIFHEFPIRTTGCYNYKSAIIGIELLGENGEVLIDKQSGVRGAIFQEVVAWNADEPEKRFTEIARGWLSVGKMLQQFADTRASKITKQM